MELGASRQTRRPTQSGGRDDGSDARGQTDARGTTGAPDASSTTDERRPGLVDATRYDLDRLERAVRRLVAQQAVLRGENDVLRKRLAEREAIVTRLEDELEEARGRRERALGRVDALIAELDRLDGLLDASVAASALQPEDAKP